MALNFTRFFSGINIRPKTTSTVSIAGDLDFDTTANKLNLHNGTVSSPVVTESDVATLTNKTIDADLNTLSNIDNNEIKALAAIDLTKLAALTANRALQSDGSGFISVSVTTAAELANLSGATGAVLSQTNTVSGITNKTFVDQTTLIQDNGDATKQFKFEASGITTATTRTLTVPDANTTLVGTAVTQTLSNKTLDNSNVITVQDSNLTLQDNLDNTKQAQFQLSGLTTATTRTFTLPDVNTTLVGTSGAQTLSNKTLDNTTVLTIQDSNLTMQDNGDNTKQLQFQLSGLTTATTRTLTAPDANTVIVGTDALQVITNKDIDGGTASNTHRVTLPKDSFANITALTRKQATLIYSSDSNHLYMDNGTALVQVDGGGGGSSSDRRNFIRNGSMQFAQRTNSAASAATNTIVCDRFKFQKNGTMDLNIVQSGTATAFNPPTTAQVLSATGSSFTYNWELNGAVVTGQAVIGTNDFALQTYAIEGLDFQPLFNQSFTVSFWVYSAITGTYSFSLLAQSGTYSYVSEYTVSSANTWEYKTITIAAPTDATQFTFDNTKALNMYWIMAAGSAFQTSTFNSWITAGSVPIASSNQVNGVNTGGRFAITGITCNLGNTALPFEYFNGSLDSDLKACQRYYQKTYDIATNVGTVTFNGSIVNDAQPNDNPALCGQLKVFMRAVPTVVYYNPGTGATGSARGIGSSANIGVNALTAGQNAISANTNTIVTSDAYALHFTVDAEI